MTISLRQTSTAIPFFIAPGGQPLRERLLLISYTFPPSQTVGALRWQKMAAFVAERGWELDVITLDPAEIAVADHSRLSELPPGTRVFSVSRRESLPHRVQRLVWRAVRDPIRRVSSPGEIHVALGTGPQQSELTYVNKSALMRAHLARMEHATMSRLAQDTARLARTIVRPGVHRAVVSSGPDHMAHEAARAIAAGTAMPFVIDMRDAWASASAMPDEFASPTWLRLAERLERRAVHAASLIVVNTEPFRDLMCARYPARCDRILTVMNGYDEEPMPSPAHGTRFVIGCSGSLYAGRNPRVLFRAAARVVGSLGLTPEQFGIEFVGDDSCEGVSVGEIAAKEGMESFVSVWGRHPRRAAFEKLARAALLVDLPQVTPLAIPAKIFEFLQFDAWLLALAEPASATARLLEDSGAHVVSPNAVDAIAAVIRARYLEYAGGVRPTRLAQGGRFSRREQAGIFLDALEQALSVPEMPAGV